MTKLQDTSVAGAAKEASASNAPTYDWKLKAPGASLMYIRNVQTANHAISQLRPGPLGFDMEWKPTFLKGERENPVALVQLANDSNILLIQISAMNAFPQKLREILSDPKTVKCGVGIQSDCKKLYNDYGIPTRNCVDLSLLARTVDNARWKGRYGAPIGLARLCETYEELTLHKGKITRSNWELPLSEEQQQYAANDGHAGYTLYRRLYAMAAAMSPAPEFVWYTFDYMNDRFCDPLIGVRWWPTNPRYDPGPPPPVKVRPPADGQVLEGSGSEESLLALSRGGGSRTARASDSSGRIDLTNPRRRPRQRRRPGGAAFGSQYSTDGQAHLNHLPTYY